ncbi:NAD(P)/FAD-dependent oxidoreductase [Natrialba asiatica]|uniref:Thioredoxin reductase-like protein n=1 Tax=Natrialba asiatica (strain ATCC 700177 / DSM 12278 / JCM 9576 / FERM P-10747 / NBRC 102637 / 172P1) TaxID=29540 RepID=M0B3T9_NATA1|nr:NAD(P)/FAD-dependent oxidoreductase [Natrialba asiatica]ELZ05556.1 thioredoxin reductase-like protein [Natrialba asiatica DSM 12278]
MSALDSSRPETTLDYDVVVVGGGPAGCSVGVFTARYDLETVIFDRGRSSIQRCAYLENYLGFPAGVDIETLYGLMHDHASTAGCEIVSDFVASVERRDDADGFLVHAQDGDPVTARFVVAATRYDGEYMRGLDGDAAMFETHEHDGEEREHFDKRYAESDGSTPVDGLFIASPYGETGYQALMAAGRGAQVGITVIEAVRREEGYPEPVANYYDWMRADTELDDEWSDRDRWRDYFDDRLPADHGLGAERLAAIREQEIDRRFAMYLSDDEIDRRSERGQRQLLEHIDDELILAAAREIDAEQRSSGT